MGEINGNAKAGSTGKNLEILSMCLIWQIFTGAKQTDI